MPFRASPARAPAADPPEPVDAELIAAVRAGDAGAFDHLYRRHVDAALTQARQLTRSPAEVDDLVADAFARVLEALRSGRGPDSAFRAYLLTTLRNARYDQLRRDRRVDLAQEPTEPRAEAPYEDPALAGFEAAVVKQAFDSLPQRWRTVLWFTEVEGRTPAEVAELLRLRPNAVAALAYRAREGLRHAYLQAHVTSAAAARCQYPTRRLGAWARGRLSGRERVKVAAHLAECERCRTVAAELAEMNTSLRSVLAPLLVAAPIALGYLAAALADADSDPAAGGLGAAAGPGRGFAGTLLRAFTTRAAAAGGVAAVTAAAAAVGLLPGGRSAAPAAAPPTRSVSPGAAAPTTSAGPSRPAGSGPRSRAAGGAAGGAAGAPTSPGLPGGTGAGPHPAGTADPTTGASTAAGAAVPVTGSTPGPSRRPPVVRPSTAASAQVTKVHADPFVVGQKGVLKVVLRNPGSVGTGPVTTSITLPPDVSMRGPGTGADSGWQCTDTAPMITCTGPSIPANGTVRLRLRLRAGEQPGTGSVTGTVSTDAGSAELPPTTVTVSES